MQTAKRQATVTQIAQSWFGIRSNGFYHNMYEMIKWARQDILSILQAGKVMARRQSPLSSPTTATFAASTAISRTSLQKKDEPGYGEKFVGYILTADFNYAEAVILEFIGGETMLEAELISRLATISKSKRLLGHTCIGIKESAFAPMV